MRTAIALLDEHRSAVVRDATAAMWENAAAGRDASAAYFYDDLCAFLAQCEANDRTRERVHALYGHHIGPGGL